MASFAPYHLRISGRYWSLTGVAESERDAIEYSSRIDSVTQVHETDAGVWGVYTPPSTPSESGAEDSSDPGVIHRFVDEVFDGVQQDGDTVWNKSYEPTAAVSTLRETEWRQAPIDVASDALSNLICRHPFPNANHRTSLAVTAMYLTTVTGLDVEETVHPETVPDWLFNQFISASKLWVTVRRRQRMFRYANRLGVAGVIRKHGRLIPFTEAVLNGDAERRHRAVCTTFLQVVTENLSEKMSGTDPGFRVFRDRIAACDRSFRDVGQAFSGLRD